MEIIIEKGKKKKVKKDPRLKPKNYCEFEGRFKIFKMTDLQVPIADLSNKGTTKQVTYFAATENLKRSAFLEDNYYPDLFMHRNQKYISKDELENKRKADGKIEQTDTILSQWVLVFQDDKKYEFIYDPQDLPKFKHQQKKLKKLKDNQDFDPIDYGSSRFRVIGDNDLFNDPAMNIQSRVLQGIKLPDQTTTCSYTQSFVLSKNNNSTNTIILVYPLFHEDLLLAVEETGAGNKADDAAKNQKKKYYEDIQMKIMEALKIPKEEDYYRIAFNPDINDVNLKVAVRL